MMRFIYKISPLRKLLTALRSHSHNLSLLNREKKPKITIAIKRNNHTFEISPEEFDSFTFKTGDQLSILPEVSTSLLFRTPDGSLHYRTNQDCSIRIPSTMTLSSYKDYLIPEHLCILTGAGTHTLDPIGQKHIDNYHKYMGLWSEMVFLEIGCGIGRDVFQLLPIIQDKGNYVGIDVTQDSIQWLKKNVGEKHPNFSFYHFDAAHELYNPLGKKKSLDFHLPVQNNTIDRIALGSVFTHLFEDEVVHYLHEIKRALKPDGLAYATFFLYEDVAISASRKKSCTPFNLRFEHPNGEGCYVNDPVYKTGAVAYTKEAILRMIDKAGLKLAKPMIRGSWSGLFPDSDDGQDVAILGHK